MKLVLVDLSYVHVHFVLMQLHCWLHFPTVKAVFSDFLFKPKNDFLNLFPCQTSLLSLKQLRNEKMLKNKIMLLIKLHFSSVPLHFFSEMKFNFAHSMFLNIRSITSHLQTCGSTIVIGRHPYKINLVSWYSIRLLFRVQNYKHFLTD